MITGIHHLGLTVSDVERSAQWYEAVLGFERIGSHGDATTERRKIFLRHPDVDARLGLVEHNSSSKAPFDETEAGLDHLAFEVPTHADVEAWEARLHDLGVPTSPIAASNSILGATLLVFRDPDNIQLEIYTDPTRP